MGVKEFGIRRTEDGGMFCEECGADLTIPNSACFAFHADGAKSYKNGFTCVKCGNLMTQEYDRDPEDAKWWQE